MKKIDLVYVLGTGSAWSNNELRFSLRSVAANLKNVGNIYVVGEKQNWLTGATCIHEPDIYKNNADANIIHKVLAACLNEELSDDFLFMNDDYFIIKKTDATKIPAYHKGDMATFDKKYFKQGFWRSRLERSLNILRDKGYTTFHYDGHLPIIINKHKFPEIIERFDYNKGLGYTMKSLYGNVAYEEGRHVGNLKKVIFRSHTREMIQKETDEAVFVAVNDHGLNIDFKRWLFETFPTKCKYEITDDCRQIDGLKWLTYDTTIDGGIELYKKYTLSDNVLRFMNLNRSTLDKSKIERHIYKLL